MATTLNPAALKAARDRKGWTQGALAEKSGCSKEQISRWERGRSLKLRRTSRERLTKALGVSWEEDLTRPPPKDKDEEERDTVTVQMNFRVSQSTRTALELVSVVYGIARKDIIELAPLLFFLLAQRSLEARKEALAAAEKQADDAAAFANNAMPYMRGAFYVGNDYEWIENERSSIESRNIFQSWWSDDGEEMSPFVTYLTHMLEKEITSAAAAGWTVEPNSPDAPIYECPSEWIRKLAGLSEEDQKDKDIVDYIQSGEIDLKEVRTKKAALPDHEYRSWLDTEFQKVDERKKAWQDHIIPKNLFRLNK
jgi:transcriptional regulator with XRE-family HTH domain